VLRRRRRRKKKKEEKKSEIDSRNGGQKWELVHR